MASVAAEEQITHTRITRCVSLRIADVSWVQNVTTHGRAAHTVSGARVLSNCNDRRYLESALPLGVTLLHVFLLCGQRHTRLLQQTLIIKMAPTTTQQQQSDKGDMRRFTPKTKGSPWGNGPNPYTLLNNPNARGLTYKEYVATLSF